MKQKINPIVAVIAGILTVAVIGLAFYFISNSSSAPATPTGKPLGADAPIKGVSPDQQVKMRMQQLQQSGQAGQGHMDGQPAPSTPATQPGQGGGTDSG
jgi:hypothetical protein